MDRYNEITMGLTKGTVFRCRFFYTASNKYVLELFFRVYDVSGQPQPTLGSILKLLKDNVIQHLSRVLSKDTYWTKLDLYIITADQKYTIPFSNNYGKRLGSVMSSPFRIEIIPESSTSTSRFIKLNGSSSEFSNFESNRQLEKANAKDGKDVVSINDLSAGIEKMLLYPFFNEENPYKL